MSTIKGGPRSNLNKWIVAAVGFVVFGGVGIVVIESPLGRTYFPDSCPYRLPLQILFYFIGAAPAWIAQIWAVIQSDQDKRIRFQSETRDKFDALLTAAVEEHFNEKDQRHLRSNVMIPEAEELRIVFSQRMNFSPDKDIRFKKGEGACGKVWQAAVGDDIATIHSPVWSEDLTKLSREELINEWNLTDQQIRLSADVVWLVSIPIIHLKGGVARFLGVLNFDGTEPLTDPSKITGSTEHQKLMRYATHFAEELVARNLC